MTLRIGLLGASRIAPLAILEPCRNLDQVEVVTIASRDPARAQAYAAEHGIADFSPSYEALLTRDDVDLVYNALPISLHERWSIAALQAGKHVLVEKPSAPTAAAAKRMLESARAANRRLIEGFHYRYHPLFNRVLEIVARGGLGPMREVRAVVDVPVPQRPGEIRWDPEMAGGALMDLGCYPVHWLRSIGGAFDVVSAKIEMASCGVDQAVEAELRFKNGATATLHCSMVPHDRGRTTTLRVIGDKGELFVRNPIAPQMGHELRWHSASDWRSETAAYTSSYFHQLLAVSRAIASEAKLLTEGEDIVENLAAIESIYRSGGFPRAQS
jgi:predicted dehydrogenase